MFTRIKFSIRNTERSNEFIVLSLKQAKMLEFRVVALGSNFMPFMNLTNVKFFRLRLVTFWTQSRYFDKLNDLCQLCHSADNKWQLLTIANCKKNIRAFSKYEFIWSSGIILLLLYNKILEKGAFYKLEKYIYLHILQNKFMWIVYL